MIALGLGRDGARRNEAISSAIGARMSIAEFSQNDWLQLLQCEIAADRRKVSSVSLAPS
jgi:hypothetical protein